MSAQNRLQAELAWRLKGAIGIRTSSELGDPDRNRGRHPWHGVKGHRTKPDERPRRTP